MVSICVVGFEFDRSFQGRTCGVGSIAFPYEQRFCIGHLGVIRAGQAPGLIQHLLGRTEVLSIQCIFELVEEMIESVALCCV